MTFTLIIPDSCPVEHPTLPSVNTTHLIHSTVALAWWILPGRFTVGIGEKVRVATSLCFLDYITV